MAKVKKTSSSKFIQKVNKITESDLFKSLAIASILFNILFFISIIVLTTTSTFDRSVYMSTKKNYCKNINGVKQRAEEFGGDTKAVDDAVNEWKISCITDDFAPYYKEAVDKFKAQSQTQGHLPQQP